MAGPTYYAYAAPFGRFTVAADDVGVCGIAFGAAAFPGAFAPTSTTNRMATQVQEYLAGKRFAFDVPLHLVGSDFRLRVWNCCAGIPYGQVRTTAQVAESIGAPTSVRAVAAACNANLIAAAVPTHRVVGAAGAPFGPAEKARVQTMLLGLERRWR